jgi:hypothetical protein
MVIPSSLTLASIGVIAAGTVGFVVSQVTEQPAGPSSTRHHVVTSVPTTSTATTRAPAVKPKRPSKPKPVLDIPIMVFNNSGIRGLAAQTATKIRQAGWDVVGVANWYGDIPATTVYFPKEGATQASKLARLLHTTRLRPSVAPMRFDRLTVILVNR